MKTTGELIEERQRSNALDVLLMIVEGLYEAVEVTGEHGAAGGHLFAPWQAQGMTLTQFEFCMQALVLAGRVRKEGPLYFASKAR